ncbi:FAD-dependent pyridine nucleotide-disulfide oxidoreductase [Purpureocillium lavendulum]|uniref:FAD-dependent pyridine nucleotide-disulfide oxidoreductase n=1 Tax=Purpureocillium lavendulum TaxID=1247861 RepID=A0AB34G3A8_9HYPO|nr:FAD-dependent pyridine nucleotide-disulfide oxidoreductase [Purpureocillium lavendulum]
MSPPVSTKTQLQPVGGENLDPPLSPAPTEPEHDPQTTTSIAVDTLIDQIALLTNGDDPDELDRSLTQALLPRGSTEKSHIRDFALRLGDACLDVKPQEPPQSPPNYAHTRDTPQPSPVYTRLKFVAKESDGSNDVDRADTDPETPPEDPAGPKSEGRKTSQSPRQTRHGAFDHVKGQHVTAGARRATPDVVAGAEDSHPKPRRASRKRAAPSELTPSMATTDSHPLPIVDQSMDDFVDDCYDQIRRLNSPEVSQDTWVDLISSMESNQSQQRWTDGSEWQALATSGQGDKTRGSLKYAATLICFANWHAAQVQLIMASSPVARSSAARGVSERVLGAKPSATDQLGKTSDADLDRIIHDLHSDTSKKEVIRTLQNQVHLLAKTGRTNETVFTSDLLCAGLSHRNQIPEHNEKAESFCLAVQKSVGDAPLTATHESIHLDPKTLGTLAPNTWLNADVIMACLMVSDRLPWVRVGISVPMHCGGMTLRTVRRPFEVAASKIDSWRKETTDELVFFFVLFQMSNHFSLLEVNDRTKSIYHYDSMAADDDKENAEIKVGLQVWTFE